MRYEITIKDGPVDPDLQGAEISFTREGIAAAAAIVNNTHYEDKNGRWLRPIEATASCVFCGGYAVGHTNFGYPDIAVAPAVDKLARHYQVEHSMKIRDLDGNHVPQIGIS